MKKESYINYIKYTLSTYNKANKKALIKLYREANIAKKKDTQINLFEDNMVDIDYANLDETIIECINRNNKAIQIYEEFQFVRSYKYAVLCKTSEEKFEDLLKNTSNIKEYRYNKEDSDLFDELKEPSKMIRDGKNILLFNKKFEAIHPSTGNELLLHYPVLLVIHPIENIVEIRFDSIKRLFTGGDRDQTIYTKLVDEMIEYVKDNFYIELQPLALDFMVELTKNDNNPDIKLLSQYMYLANGGKAQLNVGNNEEYVLPLIGELKNIINELKEELDKNLKIKDALEQFIYEKEETTDYPWIEVLFLNKEGIKTRNNHVKFTFCYMNKDYSLITYYYNDTLIEMERMDDVTRFIGENFNK